MNIPSIIPELKVVSVREFPSEQMSDALKFLEFWRSVIEQSSWYDSQKEMLIVVLLDTKHQIIGFNLVSLGILNETLFHPREVLRPAVIAAAHAIVLMHNHPSGQPAPSEADRLITGRMRKVSLIMGIELLDHIIVGDWWAIYSFHDSQALETGYEPLCRKKGGR